MSTLGGFYDGAFDSGGFYTGGQTVTSQSLFLDNRDGFGPRAFTRYLRDANQFFSHNKNEPQTFSFDVVNIDSLTSLYYSDVIRRTSNLLSYHRLAETGGTVAADASGNSHTGTYSGGVTLGQLGAISDGTPSATFDGSTGKVAVGALDIGAAFTVEGWVKTTFTASQQAFWSNRQTGGGGIAYVGTQVGGKMFLFMDASTPSSISGTTVIADGAWHHVVYANDGTTTTFYIDGNLEKTGAQSHAASVGAVASLAWDASAGNFWAGSLDEVAVYGRALSAAEVAAHYAARLYTGDSAPEWTVPKRGAFVKFSDSSWDTRHKEIGNGVLFTGYVTEEPQPVLLGIGSGGDKVWGYHIDCTSEEFLANSKQMPPKIYVNKTRGAILKDLLEQMFAESVPFPFNTDGIRDGGIEKLFTVDTTQKWAELAAAFAGADGFFYYILDGYIFYGPQDYVTTYSDPLYQLVVDEFDPRFVPSNLDIKRVARDIVNDVSVLGLDEPSDIVNEHFVSDGFQGAHNLAYVPYGIEENNLIIDDFTSDLDTSLWQEEDTGADYIQAFDGALNIVGGPGAPATGASARTVYLLARRPVEMSGIIEFRDGEVYFPPSPTGTGIIGGLYTDTTLSNNALWSGWKIDCTNRLFIPLTIGATPVGTNYPIVATRNYILRRTIQIDRPVGSPLSFTQTSTGATYSHDSVVNPRVSITFKIDEINTDDPANVFTTTAVLAQFTLTLANPPDFLLYAAAAPNDCHYVTNYLSVTKPQQGTLKVNGLPVKLGNYLDGGRALLQDDNGHGTLAWYATPTGSAPTSYSNKVLGDGPVVYWRLDEVGTTTIKDSSGHSHSGSSNSVTQGGQGAINADPDTATAFNGSSSFITGAGFTLEFAGAGSVEGWFKTTASGLNTIYSTRDLASHGEFFAVLNGQLSFGSTDFGSALSVRTGLNDGLWHHFVAAYRSGGGSNCDLYIDGVHDQSLAQPRFPGSNTWYIGKDIYVDSITPGQGFFNGSLDEIAIYFSPFGLAAGTLTLDQVKAHYTAGISSQQSVTTVPPAGSTIELTYYRSQQAKARMRSTESIKTERGRYRDDGVRQRIIRAADVTPSPRTSEECLALAQAFLNDSSTVRHEGTYSFDVVANTPTDLAFWPKPGDIVDCSLDLPSGPLVSEPLIIQTVDSQFQGLGAYNIKLGFGPVNRWDIVIRNMILQRKTTLDDPQINLDDADILETVNQAYPYPADLLDCTVTSITATQFSIALAASGIPAEVVNYEVRTDDTGWGNTNTGYVTRFRATSQTFSRPKRDLLYFIRPYNVGGEYSKRSAVIRIAAPTANTFVMTGVTGTISPTQVSVKIPIPRDPDYAGIVVRQDNATGADLYKGNGDTNVTVAYQVEVLLTIGFITVNIPNPGVTSYPVFVNTYNLLGLEGTGLTFTVTAAAPNSWTDQPYSAGNFTMTSGGTWAVDPGDQVAFTYTIDGNTMNVSYRLLNTTISGTAGNTLQIAIPGGNIANRAIVAACALRDNTIRISGTALTAAGDGHIFVKRIDQTNFSNTGTNNTDVEGQIAFEIR